MDLPVHARCIPALLLSCWCASAQANCGSAFCAINTDWNAQGAWTQPGGRLDLRYEFIDQDQPRTGTRDVGVGEIPQHHDEIRTINRNWIAEFDYTFNQHWGIGVVLPVVSRSHSHIHNHMGTPLLEEWSFSEVGDARVVGRYVLGGDHHAGRFGLQAGLKLPTGKYDVANDNGDVAERSLQPGTGTTDAIVGAFYSGPLGSKVAWFGSAYWNHALNEREDYKPGDRFGVDVGMSVPVAAKTSALLQLNGLWKGHESGANGEPDVTGGTFVFLSPGLNVSLAQKTQLYGFVQFPLYQNVRGVQLVADWALAVGLSQRF
jgi:hypothetical protein